MHSAPAVNRTRNEQFIADTIRACADDQSKKIVCAKMAKFAAAVTNICRL